MGNGSACPEKLYLSLQPWTCPKNAWASFTKFWKIKHHAPNSLRSILEISTSKIISNACSEVLTANHKQGYKINKTIWPTVNWFYTYCNALLRGSGFADARFLYAGFRYTRFLRACFPYARFTDGKTYETLEIHLKARSSHFQVPTALLYWNFFLRNKNSK